MWPGSGASVGLVQPAGGYSSQHARLGAPGCPALGAGRRLGLTGSNLVRSFGASRRLQRALSARVVTSTDVANSALPVAGTLRHTPPPAASSNGAGPEGTHSVNGGGGGSGSSSSSNSQLNGSSSGASAPPDRAAATASELLQAVLRRRADRLQRQQQQDSGAPDATQVQPSPAQHQLHSDHASSQQLQPPQPPPRYPPHWATSSPNGAQRQDTEPMQRYNNPSPASAQPSSSQPGPASAPPSPSAGALRYPTASAAPQQPAMQPPSPANATSLVHSPEQRTALSGGPPARDEGVPQRRLVTVRFWLKFRAEWGQRLKVVGTHTELGAWGLSAAPELKWSEGDNWHTTVQLPAGGVAEYKYVLLDHSGHHPLAWQQGNNSVLALRPGDELVEVFDNWNADPGATLVADGGQPVTRETRLLAWAAEMDAQLSTQRQDLRRSRMELAAAQEEARDAQAQAQRFRAQLAALEAERAAAASHLQQARALNVALQSQLTDTTASFQEALRTAAFILSQIDDVSSAPADAATAAAAAAPAVPPPLPPFQLPEVAGEEPESAKVEAGPGETRSRAEQQQQQQQLQRGAAQPAAKPSARGGGSAAPAGSTRSPAEPASSNAEPSPSTAEPLRSGSAAQQPRSHTAAGGHSLPSSPHRNLNSSPGGRAESTPKLPGQADWGDEPSASTASGAPSGDDAPSRASLMDRTAAPGSSLSAVSVEEAATPAPASSEVWGEPTRASSSAAAASTATTEVSKAGAASRSVQDPAGPSASPAAPASSASHAVPPFDGYSSCWERSPSSSSSSSSSNGATAATAAPAAQPQPSLRFRPGVDQAQEASASDEGRRSNDSSWRQPPSASATAPARAATEQQQAQPFVASTKRRRGGRGPAKGSKSSRKGSC